MTSVKYKALIMGAMMTVVGAACGGGGDSSDSSGGAEDADRVIEVAMTDNAFDPTTIPVSAGETVTFRFTNNGAVVHDAFIGDAQAQEEHGESMEAGDEMEGHNMDGGDALLLEPGDSGEMTHTFEDAGEILIGCHKPGHYEAGMKSTVTVS